MRALAVVVALAGGAAAADEGCFGPGGRVPRAVTFEGGAVVRDIRREGDVLSYETRHPEIGAIRTSVHAGVFPLSSSTRHGQSRHVWTGALPGRAELVPGARFERTGVLTGLQALALPVRIEVEVGERGEVRLGGCTYRTVSVTARMAMDGQPPVTVLREMDPETLVVFRSVTTRPAGGGQPAMRQESRAVGIE